MTSEVSIANRALQALGAHRIESLAQDHPNAASISAAFDSVRDAELRRNSWGFAIARKSIAASSTATVWGGWSQYSLPGDFIRLLREDESGVHVDWRIEGQHIVTKDSAPLEIRYISRVVDASKFDPLFAEALALKLAHECCQEITQSNGKKTQLRSDYKEAIAEAKRIGAIEGPVGEFLDDSWVNARL